MLRPRDVLPYLLAHGLLSPRSVVDSEIVVLDSSRRNRNYTVLADPDSSYVLKQGVGPDRIATVAREAATYRLLQRQGGVFARYLPDVSFYDADEHILVLELVPESETLREYHIRRGGVSPRAASSLGRALRLLHRIPPPAASHVCEPPWVLALDRPPLTLLHDFSSASVDLLRVARTSDELAALLRGLAETWSASTLVHYDLRWENCVRSRAPASRDAPRLRIVDWELSGLGDPCWDVGCVFAEYLAFWLTSLPTPSALSTGDQPTLALFPLDRVQPAIDALWSAYAGADASASQGTAALLPSVRFCGVRLAQIALEQMQSSARLTRTAVSLLQVGLNMLSRPLEASVILLGVTLAK
jgi:aminoglycoside phosphotransferase (APT) family kinase protein